MLQVFYELTPNTFAEMQTVRYRTFQVGVSCNQGNPNTGKVPFDDPGGTLTIKGWRKVRVVETEATPTLLWSGRIRDKSVKRGDSERNSLRVGADRWWDCDAIDQNTLIPSRIIRDGNRPAESAGERLTWLLGTSYTVLHDEGHVTYPTNRLDATDYTLQTAANVLEDCALPGGYVYFAMQVDTLDGTDTPELFFMKPGSSDWASTVSLSDDFADVDGETVFAPSYDAALDIIDEQIASGVAVPYAGGDTNSFVYVSDTDIGDEFAYVDRAAPMANVKTSAKATVIANRHLVDSSTEAEQITTSVLVRADQANLIRPWHRIPYKSTWMPNFASYRDCRVTEWSIEQHPHPDGGDGYRVHLQLSPVDESVTPSSCSTVIGATTSVLTTGLETAPSPSVGITPTDDTVLIAWLAAANQNSTGSTDMTAISGYTELNNTDEFSKSTYRIATKEASGGALSTAAATFTPGFSSSGGWMAVQVAIGLASGTPVQTKWDGPAFAATLDAPPTPGNIVLVFAHVDSGSNIHANENTNLGPTSGWVELFNGLVDPPGGTKMELAIFARCVETGETGEYSYAYTSGYSTARSIFIAEFAA